MHVLGTGPNRPNTGRLGLVICDERTPLATCEVLHVMSVCNQNSLTTYCILESTRNPHARGPDVTAYTKRRGCGRPFVGKDSSLDPRPSEGWTNRHRFETPNLRYLRPDYPKRETKMTAGKNKSPHKLYAIPRSWGPTLKTKPNDRSVRHESVTLNQGMFKIDPHLYDPGVHVDFFLETRCTM